MRYKTLYMLASYTAVIGILLVWKQPMLQWIQESGRTPLIIVFLCAVLLALVPFIPFGIVSAVLGAKYGFISGGFLSLTASSLAACLMYVFFRYVGVQWGIRILHKSDKLRQWDSLIRRHWFWSVLVARMIPIMPAIITNSYAGVFNMAFKPFVLATFIGKIPVMVVFAFVGENIADGSGQWISALVLYGCFLAVVYGGYKLYTLK